MDFCRESKQRRFVSLVIGDKTACDKILIITEHVIANVGAVKTAFYTRIGRLFVVKFRAILWASNLSSWWLEFYSLSSLLVVHA